MSRLPAPKLHEAQLRLYRNIMAHRPFRRVLARLGIDLSGSWWRGSEDMIARALNVCANCREVEACHRWLEQAPASQPYPSFCPNGKIIEACRIEAHPLETDETAPREPGLAAMLGDDIVKQLMAADRVAPAIVRQLLGRGGARIEAAEAPVAPLSPASAR
jgi:hypothetical protein